MSQLIICWSDFITEYDVRNICGYKCTLGTYLDTRNELCSQWSSKIYSECIKVRTEQFIIKKSNIGVPEGSILTFSQLLGGIYYSNTATYVIENANMFRCQLHVICEYRGLENPKLQVTIRGIVNGEYISFFEVIKNYKSSQ